jgi:hypothetical protein
MRLTCDSQAPERERKAQEAAAEMVRQEEDEKRRAAKKAAAKKAKKERQKAKKGAGKATAAAAAGGEADGRPTSATAPSLTEVSHSVALLLYHTDLVLNHDHYMTLTVTQKLALT